MQAELLQLLPPLYNGGGRLHGAQQDGGGGQVEGVCGGYQEVPSSRNDQTNCEFENSLLFVLYLYCLGKLEIEFTLTYWQCLL